ncbi:DEAD/DEAH box helicase [Martelella mediterranea]|nr:DEAD/DEAH box helicase [Martelella mediterranea]
MKQTSLTMQIDHEQIRRLFDAATFERGVAYARQGRVLSAESDEDGALISASVRGSGQKVYVQEIALARNYNGAIRTVSGDCSCPVGYNCKHVVAVIIDHEGRSVAARHAPAQPRAATLGREHGLPPALAFWLDALRKADTETAEDPDDWPPTVRDRLLYVVAERASGGLFIDTMKGRLLRDDSFGERATRYDAARVLRTGPPKFIRQTDMRILRRINLLGLEAYSSSFAASHDNLAPGDIFELLRLVAATGRGRWFSADGPALRIADARHATVDWTTETDGSQKLRIRDEAGHSLKVLGAEPPLFADLSSGEVGPLEFDGPKEALSLLVKAPAIPAAHAEKIAVALNGLQRIRLPAPTRISADVRQGRDPVPVLRLFTMPAMARYGGWGRATTPTRLAALRLAFDYDGHCVPFSNRQDAQFLEDGKAVTLRRDLAAEDRAFQRIEDSGALTADELYDIHPGADARPRDMFFLQDDQADDGLDGAGLDFGPLPFMAQTLPELKQAGWRIETDPDWPFRFYEGPVEIAAEAAPRPGDNSGNRFSLGLRLDADEQHLDLAPLILGILDQLSFIDADGEDSSAALEAVLEDMAFYPRLGDGRFIELDASVLLPLVKVFLSASGLLDGFHKAEAGRLKDIAEALAGSGISFRAGPDLLALGKRLQALASAPEVEPPPSFLAELRPYQKTGYGWLQALSDSGFGGILADDMGLGKTVQTLALLADRHLHKGAGHPSLLVVPTSIAHAWRRQAALFAPGLKTLVLQGPERKAHFENLDDYHLVITTYPLINRDHDILMPRMWDTAILDEAQAVKNPASAVAKRIRDIRARMRVALTGTPMENSLSDLWALFDWLVPGLLGDRKTFRARFLLPIEKNADARAQAELNARIRPFLLRRTKAQVTLDLPEKTEITELVSLGDKQVALYETIRLAMDERVRRAIAEKGLAASHITILDALLKLRQICCDPKLLKHDNAASIDQSAKRERLMDLLGDLVAEGRRVLVFSQFVEMLDLIRTDIEARGWPHAWLTGDTVNRDAVVTGFQAGDVPIFLLSLKAGGVGLTLTAADTVILYDPWWNPAVERQAMDRVHRIGQQKSVFVYRLIAEGSVEQAIAQLQERKQALADALFEGPVDSPLSLDEAEITALFQPIQPEH